MRSIIFKLCIVAGAGMFIFGNCNKNSDPAPGNANDFSPLTTGSSWTYLNTPGGVSVLTVTSRDSVALTHTYKVLSNSNGPNNYLNKTGNDYYRFGVLAAVAASGEELYLKSDQAVSGAWSTTQNFTYLGTSIPATLSYVIKEKGVSRTVNSKAFSNVTHVRLDAAALSLSLGGGDFYYAAGIGLIESSLTITVPGQAAFSQAQILTAYDIK